MLQGYLGSPLRVTRLAIFAALVSFLCTAAHAQAPAAPAKKPMSSAARSAATGIIKPRDTPGLADAPYAPAGSPRPSNNPRDLQGSWLNMFFVIVPFTTVTAESAPYTAEAQNMLWHRINMSNIGTPVAEPGVLCRPPGLVRDMNESSPFEIVQGKDKIVLMQEEGHSVRIVWMDQKHPADIKPSYTGHSVGHWDGDTLVVDTIGFNGKTWIDYAGSPHGKKLHIVERIRKVELGGPYPDLQDLITIDDPQFYTAPWTVLKTYRWRPDQPVGEYNCEENNRSENTQGVEIENPALLGK